MTVRERRNQVGRPGFDAMPLAVSLAHEVESKLIILACDLILPVNLKEPPMHADQRRSVPESIGVYLRASAVSIFPYKRK